jgi:transcriptional regulator with XRE-family HTH domain
MARVEEQFTYTSGIPADRIAETLLIARSSAGIDQKSLAKALDTSLRRVRRWETAEEIPSDAFLDRIGELCAVTAGEMFPARDHVEFDPRSMLMRVGTAVVSIVEPNNEIVLTTFLRLVRQQRGLWPDDKVSLRGTDVDLLSTVLDLNDETLENRLVHQIGLTPQAAAELRFRMIRRRHPSNRAV